MADFQQLLVRVLAEPGMSNAQLAKELGIARSQVGRWLRGALPSEENYEVLARRFRVSVEVLAAAVAESRSAMPTRDQIGNLVGYVHELEDRNDAQRAANDHLSARNDDLQERIERLRHDINRLRTNNDQLLESNRQLLADLKRLQSSNPEPHDHGTGGAISPRADRPRTTRTRANG